MKGLFKFLQPISTHSLSLIGPNYSNTKECLNDMQFERLGNPRGSRSLLLTLISTLHWKSGSSELTQYPLICVTNSRLVLTIPLNFNIHHRLFNKKSRTAHLTINWPGYLIAVRMQSSIQPKGHCTLVEWVRDRNNSLWKKPLKSEQPLTPATRFRSVCRDHCTQCDTRTVYFSSSPPVTTLLASCS